MAWTRQQKQFRRRARNLEPAMNALGGHRSRREVSRASRAVARDAIRGPVLFRLGPGGAYVREYR
jgi:hypothetical protein